MKKLVLGIAIGVMLSMSTTVFAEGVVNLVGKTIEGMFPLKIDGKRTENDAIVVDGTSYIPVRSAGELFGYDVAFDPEGEIILNKKQSANIPKESTSQQTSPATEEAPKKDYDGMIQMTEANLNALKAGLASMSSDDNRRPKLEDAEKKLEDKLEQLKAEKAAAGQ